MLFARCRKQGHRKENSEDGLANEATHNALAQLSVSAAVRKDESAVVGRDHSLLAVARAGCDCGVSAVDSLVRDQSIH